jgi:hypothetical protein
VALGQIGCESDFTNCRLKADENIGSDEFISNIAPRLIVLFRQVIQKIQQLQPLSVLPRTGTTLEFLMGG